MSDAVHCYSCKRQFRPLVVPRAGGIFMLRWALSARLDPDDELAAAAEVPCQKRCRAQYLGFQPGGPLPEHSGFARR
jgi:hypothetical protein